MGDAVNVAARVEGIAESGGIAITRAVHEQVRDKLDLGFVDKGEIELKNIQRPVQVFVISGAKVAGQVAALPLPDKPSIAVLPFQNMSGDAEQEYFVDGLVEDIITGLSRFSSLYVVARNSSFAYKGKSPDIRQVGKELGVRYVLEGSVRKAGGRLRITGQLIETATGTHLWADKFDGALADVFDLQDQVTFNVVGAIAPALQLAETERTRRKTTSNLDAYDLFLRGSSAVWEGNMNEAIAYLKKAIEKDDRYAEALGLCAGTYVVVQSYGGTAITPEERAEALRFADRAATLGTDDALALARAAQALVFFGREYERGSAMVERAVELNPNLSSVWLVRGWINVMSSDIERAKNSFFRVLQFSKVDPARIGACCGLSYCCFHLGNYEDGCVWAAQALQKYANALYLVPLIMNAQRAGRKEEARNAANRLLHFAPNFRAPDVVSFRKIEYEENALEALREAGLRV
jgi:adenylate cyclase